MSTPYTWHHTERDVVTTVPIHARDDKHTERDTYTALTATKLYTLTCTTCYSTTYTTATVGTTP